MLKNILVTCSLGCALTASSQKLDYSLHTSRTVDTAALRKGFHHPPAESRLRCYWWWLNSMVTKESITRDLQEMKAKGYGGASLVDAGSSNYTVAAKTPAGPVFMSAAWMELYRHAVKEADRLGIELSVNVQSGWNPGGPGITPELALKKIVFSDTTIRGGRKISMPLRQPDFKLLYHDIRVQAFPEAAGTPVKNEAIRNWTLKSFNQSFGMSGTYPLYRLREEDPGTGTRPGLNPSDIIDLTARYSHGVLTWDVPPGEWTIIRYGWTCTGAQTSTNSDGWSGLSLDHLDPQAFKKFSNDVILPLVNGAQAVGRSVHFLQTDSWEMGNVGWTARFAEAFKKFRGYDLAPYLPVLAGRVVGSVDRSDRFLHDYRRTIGDCIAANHYQLFSNLAHAHGMGIHPESGGPHSAPVDALSVMAISDFPQGEFWAMANTHRVKDDERLAVKQSACVAHTNGKKFVAAEGPTSIGPQWERAPRDLKSNIDRIFCSGINRIVWHTFTSSPKEAGLPGNEYFAGTHLNPNVTWWQQAGDFIGYLNRCSYLLSQGLFTADVLYYYGDDVPNFVFLKEDVKDLPQGHDWDKCSRDALLKNITVKEGNAVFPDGMRYRVLVLPNERSIDPAVLRRLETLVQQGLTVIGPRPVQSTGLLGFPQADQEIGQLAARLWGPEKGSATGEHAYGKGRVIWGKAVKTVLEDMKVAPDFSFASPDTATALDYIHRAGDGVDIYFVANRFGRRGNSDFTYRYLPTLPDRYEQAECTFRVSGMAPELWDPVTGETTPILTYREENGRTIVPLHLGPDGSQFIIFRKASPTLHVVAVEKDGQPIFPGNSRRAGVLPSLEFGIDGKAKSVVVYEAGSYTLTWSDGHRSEVVSGTPNAVQPLTAPWTLSFDPRWGGPRHVETDSLRSWTEFADSSIRYYSGTAVYTTSFTVQERALSEKKVLLDLGNVLEMGSVTLNGTALPVRWCAPFRYDVTGLVKPGPNALTVTVVNLWPNRLIGDGRLPPEKRLTKTNIKKYDMPGSDTLLRVSGLLGPVSLRMAPMLPLK